MIVTAYIDETGLQGPRASLAGYVSRVSDWHGFVDKWGDLLDEEEIPYSHVMEMRAAEHPFEGWDEARIDRFYLKAQKPIAKYCSFGLTVAVDTDVWRDAYLANMPKGTSGDSVYGLCARVFFEKTAELVERYMGLRHAPINFVLERHKRFSDAERIFDDLKKYEPLCRERLGLITPGDYTIAGLQAADLLAFAARRMESRVTFSDAPKTVAGLRKRQKQTGLCQIIHVPIDESHAPSFHRSASEIARLTRRDANIRKRERKAASA